VFRKNEVDIYLITKTKMKKKIVPGSLAVFFMVIPASIFAFDFGNLFGFGKQNIDLVKIEKEVETKVNLNLKKERVKKKLEEKKSMVTKSTSKSNNVVNTEKKKINILEKDKEVLEKIEKSNQLKASVDKVEQI